MTWFEPYKTMTEAAEHILIAFALGLVFIVVLCAANL